jgi:hypothetical protein
LCGTARSTRRRAHHLKGLRQEVERSGAQRDDGSVHAAEGGHDDDRHVGAIRDHAIAELDAAHAAHVQIGEDDVDVTIVTLANAASVLERVVTSSGRPRSSSAMTPACSSSTTRTRVMSSSLQVATSWTCSFVEAAGDVDPAAVVLHDAVRDRESQAGSIARVLGREERLEMLAWATSSARGRPTNARPRSEVTKPAATAMTSAVSEPCAAQDLGANLRVPRGRLATPRSRPQAQPRIAIAPT